MKFHRSANTHSTQRTKASDDSIEAIIGKHITPLPNGCWAYRNNLDDYGEVIIGGTATTAHRWVYSVLVGDVEPGSHIHHECLNPGCVNPEHLVQLSPKDHSARHAEIRKAQVAA